MSSTYSINKRLRERNSKYMFTNTLGDTYIRPYGKCHPDFNGVPIDSKPEGVLMCVRKKESWSTDRSVVYSKPIDRFTNFMPGENREGIPKESTQMPNQPYLVANDILRWERNTNGLGIPNSLKSAQGRNGYFLKSN